MPPNVAGVAAITVLRAGGVSPALFVGLERSLALPDTNLHALSAVRKGCRCAVDRSQRVQRQLSSGDKATSSGRSMAVSRPGAAASTTANEKNVKKGWATVSPELPCWPIRASPYSVVDETKRAGAPKFRLTNDMSWPHFGIMPDGDGGFVESLNGSMRREEWPENKLPRVKQLSQSAAVFEAVGAPFKAWGFDCEAFYRVMGRQRSELWRNAIATIHGFQLDERCCFGSAADATKCARISNAIRWLVVRAMREVDAAFPPRDPKIIEWRERRRAAALSAGC